MKKKLKSHTNCSNLTPHDHNAKALLQNSQYGSRIKIAKNMPKTSLETCQSCSVEKMAPKKHQVIEKWQVFEKGQNWPQCKGCSFVKWSVWLKNTMWGKVGSNFQHLL